MSTLAPTPAAPEAAAHREHLGFPVDLPALDPAGRAAMFLDARTVNSFSGEPVTDEQLRDIWNLAKMGPSAANSQPLRVLFVRTQEGRERLAPHMAEGNLGKTASAPAVAVLAYDSRFHEHLPAIFPMRPEMRDALEENESGRHDMAQFNAALQIGTFILAVRAVGLAAGPMAGFDREGVDREFFGDGRWRSLLVVNIGHPGETPWFDRLPRLDASDAVRWA